MSKKLLVPKLRFKEFSGEWEEKKYGSIYSFYSTNSLSRDKLNYKNGLVKNIHYGDIHKNFNTLFNINNEYVPYVNIEVDLSKIKEENYCLNGDLVIADASEDYTDIGKTIEIIKLNNEKVIAGLHTFLARPNKREMALGYSGYLLQTQKVRMQIMTISQGTKVLSLSTRRLANITLTLPNKPEQKKIAIFLTAVDKKIEQLSKKQALLKKYKKALMQKLFSQKLRFKTDDGNNFLDWEEKKLGAIFEQRTEKNNHKAELLSVTISNGVKKRSDIDAKNNSSNDKSNYRVVKKGDIAYNSMRMWQGASGVSFFDGIVSPAYTVLKSNHANNSNYFGYLFKMTNMIQTFQRNSQGLTSDTWNLKYPQLSIIKIQTPCLEEQAKIANFLSSADTKTEQVDKQLRVSKQFKKSLLQQMFI